MHLGHMSEKGLEILSKQGLLGNHKVKPLQFHEHCVYGKQHTFKSSTPGRSKVLLSIIDDYSRMTCVFMMKQKYEAFKCFKHWMTLMQNQKEKKVKHLRTNNGLELCYEEFNEFYKKALLDNILFDVLLSKME